MGESVRITSKTAASARQKNNTGWEEEERGHNPVGVGKLSGVEHHSKYGPPEFPLEEAPELFC